MYPILQIVQMEYALKQARDKRMQEVEGIAVPAPHALDRALQTVRVAVRVALYETFMHLAQRFSAPVASAQAGASAR